MGDDTTRISRGAMTLEHHIRRQQLIDEKFLAGEISERAWANDAANDIRDYIKNDMEPYDKLEDEIMHVTMMMDALRVKIDALGANFEKEGTSK